MKKEIMLDGTKLFVARVRIVLKNNRESGTRETAHYNKLGYRLFLQKNDKTYIDILTRDQFPVLRDDMEEHSFFILDPKPFYYYASNLRIKEKAEDIIYYAKFVANYFNKNLHNESKWFDSSKYVHQIHHRNDRLNEEAEDMFY